MLGKEGNVVAVLWCLSWAALSTAWCWSAAHAIGATFDEPFYIQGGLHNWHDWNHRELLTQGTMPLPAEVQTLPLRCAEWWLGAEPQTDLAMWLPVARMATIVFWWLLLWASYRIGALYGGIWAGNLAVALTACEPVLLGHASLATTDVAFTACLLALIAVFRGRRDEPTWRRRLLVPAIWCTLCLLAKASALVFVPVCLTMVEAERLWRGGWRPAWRADAWRPVLDSLRDLAAIGLAGMVLLLAVCPRAPRGLFFQIRHNLDGTGGSYLLGEVNPNGFWYYFAAALAIKLTLTILVLGTLLLLMRPRALMNGAVWAAFGLLALSPTFRVQIGVRLVLPIAALAITGAAVALARWRQEQSRAWRIGAAGFAAILVLWSVLSACSVWPHGICYTNELFGGTRNGYLALSDSNYDWGQGLKELAAWQRRHDDAPLHVWYFGLDPAIDSDCFHPLSGAVGSDGEALERRCQGGRLAVSTTALHGLGSDGPAARYLRTQMPCDRTTTFLIYDFTRPKLHVSR